MKRNFWKMIKQSKNKLALCAIMAGLSAFSVGFTNQNEGIEVEKIKTIEEVKVEVPTITYNTAVVQAAEFVNTTREIADNPPEETVIEPISVIDNAENLAYDDNYEEENLEYDEGMNYTAVMAMEATAYLPSDGDGAGITAMGIPATYGVVAVDPSIIPLGSRVYIPGYGMAIAADTGGAIVGYCIDLCMESYAEAMEFGRRIVTVYVLD